MNRTLIFFKNYYQNVVQSIAFFPVLICTTLIILAFVMLQLDASKSLLDLKKEIAFLLIEDVDTARTMLSTLIGGIFSLTVFSFSMVMVVLNQSSSNFSPRLLPNLISNKKNQIILGIYIGTLLYSLIILMNIETYEEVKDSVGLSVLLGVVFGVSCTGLFVYFIHTISQDIQIQNIIERIYNDSLNFLGKQLKEQEMASGTEKIDGAHLRFVLRAPKTGYYKGYSKNLMSKLLDKINLNIEIIPTKNTYLFEGDPLLKYNIELSKEDLEALSELQYIETNMHDVDDYFSNMVKLMEVSVRAMSPGVNDPGTAIEIINKLGILARKTFQLKEQTTVSINQSKIQFNELSYTHTLNIVFQPIRQYAKADYNVTKTLAKTLRYLLNNEAVLPESHTALKAELESLLFDANESITNKQDLGGVLELLDSN